MIKNNDCRFYLFFGTEDKRLTSALLWFQDCAGKKEVPTPPDWIPWPAEVAGVQKRRHVLGSYDMLEFNGQFMSGDVASVVMPLLPYIRAVAGEYGGRRMSFDSGSCSLVFEDGGVWSATAIEIMRASLSREGL
jgi:hypothetical protein